MTSNAGPHPSEADTFPAARTEPGDSVPAVSEPAGSVPAALESDGSPSARTASASRKNSQMENPSDSFNSLSNSTKQKNSQMENAPGSHDRGISTARKTPQVETISDELCDDGHTIADMSAFDALGETRLTSASSLFSPNSRDIREELGDKDSRRALIFGATWAGLSIGLIYIIVFGIVITLLLFFWR